MKRQKDEKMSRPQWIEDSIDEELWGTAVALGVPPDVLSSKRATAAFVSTKQNSGLKSPSMRRSDTVLRRDVFFFSISIVSLITIISDIL